MSLLSEIKELNNALDTKTVIIRGTDQPGSFKDDIYQHKELYYRCVKLALIFTLNPERRDKLKALLYPLTK